MASVLVTGAGGFIGKALIPALRSAGHSVTATLRGMPDQDDMDTAGTDRIRLDIGPETNWHPTLQNIDVIVHLAGIAHETRRPDQVDEYLRVNVAGSERLAAQAAEAGVRRLIFLSSIKVHGEQTTDRPFSARDVLAPRDVYASSKAQAEQALRAVAEDAELEVVIIRPPLVYGPGMKGNLASLLKLIQRGVPMPIAGIHNRRDLISVYNLCDLILTCIDNPEAGGKSLLACDGEPLSTTDLARHLARGAGRPARVFYVPPGLLSLLASLAGQGRSWRKIASNLEIDMSDTHTGLGWKPPYSVAESFRKTFESKAGA